MNDEYAVQHRDRAPRTGDRGVRSITSLLLAISFLSTGSTGLLMFFHVHGHGIHRLHEWEGVFFVAAAVLHLVLNWRAFLGYFFEKASVPQLRRRVLSIRSLVVVAVALAASVVALVGAARSEEGQGRRRGRDWPELRDDSQRPSHTHSPNGPDQSAVTARPGS